VAVDTMGVQIGTSQMPIGNIGVPTRMAKKFLKIEPPEVL